MTPQPYEPPTGDEPLDHVERALVRALASAIVKKIRAKERPAEEPPRRRLVERHTEQDDPAATGGRTMTASPPAANQRT